MYSVRAHCTQYNLQVVNYAGTYIPHKSVEVVETIRASIIKPNEALRLRALKACKVIIILIIPVRAIISSLALSLPLSVFLYISIFLPLSLFLYDLFSLSCSYKPVKCMSLPTIPLGSRWGRESMWGGVAGL